MFVEIILGDTPFPAADYPCLRVNVRAMRLMGNEPFISKLRVSYEQWRVVGANFQYREGPSTSTKLEGQAGVICCASRSDPDSRICAAVGLDRIALYFADPGTDWCKRVL